MATGMAVAGRPVQVVELPVKRYRFVRVREDLGRILQEIQPAK
jgi:hypothetical protein